MFLSRTWLGVAVLACAVSASADLAEVKGGGALRVLVMGVRSGDEFFAPAGPHPGFDREVLEGFASLQRVRLDVVPAASWDALIPGLLAGKGDVIAGRFTVTESRKKLIAFTSEVFPTRNVVLTRRPHRVVSTIAELREEKVGTVRGTSLAEAVAAAGVPAANVDSSIPSGTLPDALKSGQAGAVVVGVENAISAQRADPALQLALLLLAPQSPSPSPSPSPADRADKAEKPEKPPEKDEPPVVTRHEARVGGKVVKYTVTTGMIPLRSEAGETEARVFFMAYTADRTGPAAQRPLMFSFNGGPGSSSVWLHLGAIGPKRVKLLDDGRMPAPPYELVDNDESWLDQTDLVFIDPVGTGFSRAAKPELGKKFWGLQGDIESVGEFIRLYLTRYQRWGSPLFVVGESYGTTRAAGLAGHLIEKGIAFNGIVLISTILNFETARFTKGNDLPYVLFLPTYAATAWYHKKLPADLQAKPLRAVLDEVERWALGDYTLALAKGDRLSGAERQAVADTLARYTGLDKSFLDQSDLRIEIQRFDKELLRDQKRTVGRLDSRFQGTDALAAGERPDFDPSLAAIRPPYTAMFNDYVRGELGYKSDLTYHILGGGIGAWDWGTSNGFADVSESLRSAFAKNPHMKLMVAKGYYDLATPYFAVEYTLSHMGLDPSVRRNVRTREYEGGHMMYIDRKELAKLHQDVAAFLQDAIAR